MSTITSTSSSITSSIPETERKSLYLRAAPAARPPRLHCAVRGAIHLPGAAGLGQICPAKALGGRQLSLGWHFDQWEFCLREFISHFPAFYARRVEEPGCNQELCQV